MRRRNAFTIVELLVAMALIIFIMAILSQAFVQATSTFRNLKAIGDMANKLRAVTTLLQRDLAADHFEGKKRLSNPNFWLNGPPTQGYFRVWQSSPMNTILEGTDLDNINSNRSTDHMLAFTLKVRGDQMGDFLTAGSNGGGSVFGPLNRFGPQEARYQSNSVFNYQWAEVTWFLQPQTDPQSGVQDSTVSGVPLYTLYRNQRLAVPDSTSAPTESYTNPTLYHALYTNFLELSCWGNPGSWPPGSTPGSLYFNSPIDLTVPARRFGMVPNNPAGLLYATQFPNMAAPIWPLPPPNGPWVPPNNPPALPYYPPPQPPLIPSYPTLAQQGAAGNLAGADIQATDVISFDVRLFIPDIAQNLASPHFNRVDPFVTLFTLYPGTKNSVFGTPPTLPPPALPNPTLNYLNGNPCFSPLAGPMVFDTWSSLNDQLTNYAPQFPNNYSQWNVAGHHASIPLWNQATQSGPIIQAIQITIRLWDAKTEQTREVTIVQAM